MAVSMAGQKVDEMAGQRAAWRARLSVERRAGQWAASRACWLAALKAVLRVVQ
jgi:hypothetical protein